MEHAQALPSQRGRRLLWSVGRIALGVYLLWCLVLSACQTNMIFPRHIAGQPMPGDTTPRGVESWWITADDGSKVEAWYFPPPPDTDGPVPCAMIFHGNGELIDYIDSYAQWYQSRGYAVLIPEYRGYGRSGGTPSQKAITQDMLAFHQKLISQPGVDGTRLVYHGRSLGSAVAAQLAEHKAPAALVLESPFLSITAMARRYLVPGFLVKHPFRTDKVLPTLGKPVLILHSTHDEIVPYSHGAKLHEITPGSKFVDLSGSHNSDLSSLQPYWSNVDAFLKEHVDQPE